VDKVLSTGATDIVTLDLKKGVQDADLVVLSSPVSTIEKQIKSIRPYLKPNAIVIDAGSTKKSIEVAARKALKGFQFVGCHPMAGSEKQGALNAQADLFEGAICFLSASHPKVEAFWKALGAKPVHLAADSHDRWIAAASHLPHAVSFSLLASIARELNGAPISGKDINPSLRVFTRLAQSDPSLWTDIFISNKYQVIPVIASLENKLKALRRAVASGSRAKIIGLLNEGNRASKKISAA
jgi:prephenate dehydrogenase